MLNPVRFASTVYVGAEVLTMDDGISTHADSVAWHGDRLLAVGTQVDLAGFIGPDTAVIGMSGKTILPGFIDPHTHGLPYFQDIIQGVNLRCPPLGSVTSLDEMLDRLASEAQRRAEGEWVLGSRFDERSFGESAPLPTKSDLDRVSRKHPVLATHRSGHTAVANSMALREAGVLNSSPDPMGGKYRRDAVGEPDGVLIGRGAVQSLLARLPPPGEEAWSQGLLAAQRDYLMAGISTTHDARVSRQAARLYQKASMAGHLPIRTYMIPDMDFFLSAKDQLWNRGNFGSNVSMMPAVKLFADGSVPGFTGWLTEPYFRPPSELGAGHKGGPVTPPDRLAKVVLQAHSQGFQVAIHAGGDAGIDSAISAIRRAQEAEPRPDARHRIEHCHCPRDDQLGAMAELGISPSFFIGHTYYWGDRYLNTILGDQRSAKISPLRSALKHGLVFSLHSDSPHVPASPLRDLYSAATRISFGGRRLGSTEQIDVADALRSVTINAAWQGFTEDSLGSLTPGKLADMVVLDSNPLAVPVERLRDIAVERVVVGGNLSYDRSRDDWAPRFSDLV